MDIMDDSNPWSLFGIDPVSFDSVRLVWFGLGVTGLGNVRIYFRGSYVFTSGTKSISGSSAPVHQVQSGWRSALQISGPGSVCL